MQINCHRYGVMLCVPQLNVFKPFFVSLNLPYSVIRGEEFGLQITVFNYLSSELQVCVCVLLVCVAHALIGSQQVLAHFSWSLHCSHLSWKSWTFLLNIFEALENKFGAENPGIFCR